MEEQKKRKSPPVDSDAPDHKKQRRRFYPRPSTQNVPSIEPGDAGIWATCARGKEGKSTIDLRDLFEDYQARLYPALDRKDEDGRNDTGLGDVDANDIEASISAEISNLKSSHNSNAGEQKKLFQPVKLETQCVLFFKTVPPVEPVTFVERICQDKAAGSLLQGCRFVKRLTPMTRMGKATEGGLQGVGQEVLHEGTMGPKGKGIKYAIRPTLRDHNVLKRDDIIQQVARAVGNGYAVDLKQPDVVILVEVYRNVLGMSVVSGKEFERLRRFNLAEIGEQQVAHDGNERRLEGEKGEGIVQEISKGQL